MSSHPYMPLYIGSYLKNTFDLTTEEHGAYLLVLMALWSRGGEFPLDHQKLAKVAGVSPKRWPRIWERIGTYFLYGNGYIRQERIDFELQKADQISRKRKLAGVKGNYVKSLKADRASLANATQTGTQTGTHTESDQKDNTGGSVERGPVDNKNVVAIRLPGGG